MSGTSDPLRSLWILEFAIRHLPAADGDRLLNTLICSLPSPSRDSFPNLAALLILRRLRHDLSLPNPPISEDTLDSLEFLGGLHSASPPEGAAPPSRSLAFAYAKVAAECAVQHLREEERGNGKGEFLMVLDRIWRRRVGNVQKSGAATRLVCPLLRFYKFALLRIPIDTYYRESALNANTREQAIDALREYVNEAWTGMGKSNLEEEAEKLIAGRAALNAAETGGKSNMSQGDENNVSQKEGFCVGEDDQILHKATAVEEGNVSRKEGFCVGEGDQNLHKATTLGVGNASQKEVFCVGKGDQNLQKATAVEEFNVSQKEGFCAREGEQNLQKATALEEGNVPQKEVFSVGEGGQSFHKATAVEEGNVSQEEGFRVGEGDQAPHKTTAVEEGNVSREEVFCVGEGNQTPHKTTAAEEAGTNILDSTKNVKTKKHGLMDRNPTARTLEWSENSVELTPEESQEVKRVKLPGGRRNIASLQPQDIVNPPKRRKKRFWTPQEEDTLREAVHKHGAGRWKFILSCYPTIFEERTEVDLKDKWRNMIRGS